MKRKTKKIRKIKNCVIVYNRIEKSRSKKIDLSEDRIEVPIIRRSLVKKGFRVHTLGVMHVDAEVVRKIRRLKPDFIFNLCESLYGDSGNEMNVAGLFELLKIPYTGSPPFVLGLALDKIKSKQILYSAGIPVPAAVIAFPRKKIDLGHLKPPYIVKPSEEDGSAGITTKSVVRNPKDVLERIEYIQKSFNEPALVEEYIEGRELAVSIIGDEHPRVIAISEIDFTDDFPDNKPKILSYEAKWNPKSPEYEGTQIVCPAVLTPKIKREVERYALKTFREIGCRDYARIDIRLTKEGKPYILEVNPNPAIFPTSEFDEARKAAGMSYEDLIESIAKSALRRARAYKS